MYVWKVYQVEDKAGNKRYLIASDVIENPEDHLEPGEEIVTDCWLSDVLECEQEEVFIIPNP